MEQTKKSGFSTAGLVLGIIGICTSIIPIVNNLSFIMGILAFIFGAVALAKKAGRGKAIAGIILGILTVVVTINMQRIWSDALDTVSDNLDKATGSKTEQVLQNELDVEIGKFEVDNKNYITTTKLKVKVTNKTTETKSFSVKIEAVDNDGTRIDEDTIYINDLKSGQSQNVEGFNLVTSDKAKQLKNAKFEILEVSAY
ncbi:MAG: DUF4190 domain-containing protein [Clostridia bacterium]|nr:DUF4190 domain-containing protein [Clostridia bacterium]